MTTTTQRHIHATFGALIVMLLIVATITWLAQPVQAKKTAYPTTTNFVCEIRGELSNEHFDIAGAAYLGNHDWSINYLDGGDEIYAQRPGEACKTETYTHASTSPRGTGLAPPSKPATVPATHAR